MSLNKDSNAYTIGIAGGTASGKSSLVRQLIGKLGEHNVACLSHDFYYKDNPKLSLKQKQKLNYDHPDSLETDLLINHIKQLKKRQLVNQPIFDFTSHCRLKKTLAVKPKSIILVEGILLLSDSNLRELLDLKIFIDVEADLRVLRRLERDMAERGRTYQSVIEQYLDTVKPMHDQFVEPSKKHADIIIPEGGRNPSAVNLIYSYISRLPSFCT